MESPHHTLQGTVQQPSVSLYPRATEPLQPADRSHHGGALPDGGGGQL